MRRVCGVVGFVGGVLCSAPGHADTPAMPPHNSNGLDAARIHFQSGREYYRNKRTAEAFAEFVEAYRLAPRAELLYNRALCLEALKLDSAALACYRGYLGTSSEAALEDRYEAETRVAELGRRLGKRANAIACPDSLVETPDVARLLASSREPLPVYTRWWPWTIVGVTVAAAVGVGLGVGLTRPPQAYTLPEVR